MKDLKWGQASEKSDVLDKYENPRKKALIHFVARNHCLSWYYYENVNLKFGILHDIIKNTLNI